MRPDIWLVHVCLVSMADDTRQFGALGCKYGWEFHTNRQREYPRETQIGDEDALTHEAVG
jgi:hypothetical protein